MFRTACCSFALMLGTTLASLPADTNAALIEGSYTFSPQASVGAAPPAEGLIFDFSVGPLFTVIQGGPCHCSDGVGLKLGPLVVFTLNYTPTDSHWVFIALGDSQGLEYFGIYRSADEKPGEGQFTMEFIP